jgi:hypothetical protein
MTKGMNDGFQCMGFFFDLGSQQGTSHGCTPNIVFGQGRLVIEPMKNGTSRGVGGSSQRQELARLKNQRRSMQAMQSLGSVRDAMFSGSGWIRILQDYGDAAIQQSQGAIVLFYIVRIIAGGAHDEESIRNK